MGGIEAHIVGFNFCSTFALPAASHVRRCLLGCRTAQPVSCLLRARCMVPTEKGDTLRMEIPDEAAKDMKEAAGKVYEMSEEPYW